MLQECNGQEKQEPVPLCGLCAGHCCCPVLQLRLLVSATGQGISGPGSTRCSRTATARVWSLRLPWLQRLPLCRLRRSGISSHLSAGAQREGGACSYLQRFKFNFRATIAISQSGVVAAPLVHNQLLCWTTSHSTSPRRHAALQYSIEQSTDSQELATDTSRAHAAACASAIPQVSDVLCVIGEICTTRMYN